MNCTIVCHGGEGEGGEGGGREVEGGGEGGEGGGREVEGKRHILGGVRWKKLNLRIQHPQ